LSYSHLLILLAHNLGVIFDKHLSLAQHISVVSKSYLHNIRNLRRISNSIDQTTSCTIATSLIHSKIDYCNSLLLNLPAIQTNRLQLVLNFAARAVTKTPNFHHIRPTIIQKSQHWLKMNEIQGSLSHINLSKLANRLTSALFFHSLHIVVLGLLLLSPLVALLSPLVLKLQIDLMLLFCGTVSHLGVSYLWSTTTTL